MWLHWTLNLLSWTIECIQLHPVVLQPVPPQDQFPTEEAYRHFWDFRIILLELGILRDRVDTALRQGQEIPHDELAAITRTWRQANIRYMDTFSRLDPLYVSLVPTTPFWNLIPHWWSRWLGDQKLTGGAPPLAQAIMHSGIPASPTPTPSHWLCPLHPGSNQRTGHPLPASTHARSHRRPSPSATTTRPHHCRPFPIPAHHTHGSQPISSCQPDYDPDDDPWRTPDAPSQGAHPCPGSTPSGPTTPSTSWPSTSTSAPLPAPEWTPQTISHWPDVRNAQ